MALIPPTLAERVYLIGFDVEKQRMSGGHEHPHMVNAAVLVELYLSGRLADEAGKVRLARLPVGARTAPPGPLLLAALGRIEAAGPKSWRHWVRAEAKGSYLATRDGLAGDRVIRLEERHLLGFRLAPRVSARDPRSVRELRSRCRRAVLDPIPAERVDVADAALVAIAAAAELNTVFSGKERREHRARIAELSKRAGPAVPALRDVVVANQSSGG